jgi:hypothetical protein
MDIVNMVSTHFSFIKSFVFKQTYQIISNLRFEDVMLSLSHITLFYFGNEIRYIWNATNVK